MPENSSMQKPLHVRVTGGTRSCNARNTFVTRAEHVRVTLSANRRFEKYNLKLSITNTCILGYFYNFTNIQFIGKYLGIYGEENSICVFVVVRSQGKHCLRTVCD